MLKNSKNIRKIGEMASKFIYLDPKEVIKRGELIHKCSISEIPIDIPFTDEDSVLVGILLPFLGHRAAAVIIEDDRIYKGFNEQYARAWFPAGALASLHSFPRKHIGSYRLDVSDAAVKFSQEEMERLANL